MALSDKLNPTYYGYVGSTKDALLIIQATLNNQLLAVPRRPHDKERFSLIQSGNIFVFIEERSGIKRWTDGIAWSPSRILGRFLVYRELDRLALNDPPISKEESLSASSSIRRKKRKKSSDQYTIEDDRQSQQQQQLQFELSLSNDKLKANEAYNYGGSGNGPVTNRALVGSLVTSYAFKDRGLIKKTLSVTISNASASSPRRQQQQHQQDLIVPMVTTETIHLVSYYSADDVINGTLKRPTDSTNLKDLQISALLYNALRESTLGSKTPMEDEGFYFFDANHNLVSLPNPTAKSIAAKQQQDQQLQQEQQQQQQEQSQGQPSITISATPSSTSTGYQHISNSYQSRLHEPYHGNNPVMVTQDYPFTINQQQRDQPTTTATTSQPQYWQQLPFYGNQPLQQYWQTATPSSTSQQQQRENSFSSISSNKRNSPVVESMTSNFSTMPPQQQQLQQQQFSNNYNPYPNQYHSNQIPKFIQPQTQYLPQQQFQQLQQFPLGHQYSYPPPLPFQYQQQQQIPLHLQQQQQEHQPLQHQTGMPLALSSSSMLLQAALTLSPPGGIVAPPGTVQPSGSPSGGNAPGHTTTSTSTNNNNNNNNQQRFFGYEV